MKNYVQKGETLTFTAAATIAGGAGMLLGDEGLFGVNSFDVVSGDEGEAQVEGVFNLPLAAVSVSQFDRAYWDDSAKNVTNVDTNTPCGFFLADSSGSEDVPVRLVPTHLTPAA